MKLFCFELSDYLKLFKFRRVVEEFWESVGLFFESKVALVSNDFMDILLLITFYISYILNS